MGGVTFIAMEFLDGLTLRHLIGGRPMGLDRLLEIGTQVSAVMGHGLADGSLLFHPSADNSASLSGAVILT